MLAIIHLPSTTASEFYLCPTGRRDSDGDILDGNRQVVAPAPEAVIPSCSK